MEACGRVRRDCFLTSVPLGSEMLDFSRAVVRRYVLVLFLLDRFLRRAFLCVASALHSARRAIAIPLGLNPTKSSDQLDHDSDVIQ